MKANYHNHIYLCKHAEGEAKDYIDKAISLNYHALAITDHAPLPEYFRLKMHSRRMSFDEYYQIYLPMMASAKLNYNNIKVYSGVEAEYFPFLEPNLKKMKEEHDLLILGQHFYKLENGDYEKIIHTKFDYHKCCDKSIIDKYFDTIKKALRSGLFKIFAHPDLIMWLYPTLDDYLKTKFKEIVDICNELNIYLEFNCNGLRSRSFKTDNPIYPVLNIYPRLDLWDYLIKDLGYQNTVINDDCHFLKHLGDNYTKWAYDYFKEHHYPYKELIEI